MRKKVTVVGGGFVGATTAQRIVDMELADVVLCDIMEGIPVGKGLDMLESTPITRSDSNVIGFSTALYANNPAIQVHGPGVSKILIGEDQIERWPEFIDLMVASIADNGGRSCINASAVVVPKYAAEIADALAQKLGPLAPLPAQDENARLAAFANPRMAESIDAAIEEGLRSQ